MAGTRMKIMQTDKAFSRTAIQIRTLDNWANSVASTSLLEQRIKGGLDQWLDARFNKYEAHFSIESQTPKLVAHLLDDIDAILPGRRVMIEWKQSETFKFNDATLEDLFNVDGIDMGNLEASLPLLMLGTHRTFVRRQIGTLWNLAWNITIAGCVQTTVAMGVAVN